MTDHRLTSADIDRAIKRREFTVLPDLHTTVCSLQLDNGVWVHGSSHSALDATEHRDTAQRGAFAVARREVWQLLNFRAADKAAHP